jgi:N-hydroxyarylamine O-acetyltransferase
MEKIMFESLYVPLPDVGRYLRRMRYDGPIHSGKDVLDALIRAHITSIPFENIDICDFHRPVSLGIPALFEKIVIRRRGGYCFELNALFMSLLTALGFSCQAVAARVLMNRDYFPPLSHRATVVTIGGERLFCDVGFGGPMAGSSLKLDSPCWQASWNGVYAFKQNGDEIMLSMQYDTGEKPLLSFSDRPVDPVDFVALNHYCSSSPDSVFLSSRKVHLSTDFGRISMEDNELRHTGSPPVVLKTREQTAAALAEVFGIEVDKDDLEP